MGCIATRSASTSAASTSPRPTDCTLRLASNVHELGSKLTPLRLPERRLLEAWAPPPASSPSSSSTAYRRCNRISCRRSLSSATSTSTRSRPRTIPSRRGVLDAVIEGCRGEEGGERSAVFYSWIDGESVKPSPLRSLFAPHADALCTTLRTPGDHGLRMGLEDCVWRRCIRSVRAIGL